MVEKNGPERVSGGAALWHGRFASGPGAELMAFTASIGFDRRLWADDIEGSTAHVRMLAEVGLMSAADADAVVDALVVVHREMSDGSFVFAESDEDIHTAIERRVTQIAGEPGARLHTGRSRNEQVATALRLWCRREMSAVAAAVLDLVDALSSRADDLDTAVDPVVLPGYTHMQRAQPVLLSHHLRAHAWALLRDADRIADALERSDVSPLGAGALAGSSLPIDPAMTSRLLGFSRPFANSLDAVSDRDHVAEHLFALALVGVHLSRIGEEWVLWSSEEFGFVDLDDGYSTGSSMMPQKKNPDIAELARGKSGRLIGNLTGLLSTLKGLPLAYNRDLQEDKEPLFDSVEQVRLGLSALTGMVSTTRFRTGRMAVAASAESLVATDIAEWLVERGTPFREAHAVVGELVRTSLDSGASLAAAVAADPRLGPEAAALFEPGAAIRRRTSPGGPGPATAVAQARLLAQETSRIGGRFR
ncbi:MAG: argininosuccinate lyase [Acidimicrobiales bacterium]